MQEHIEFNPSYTLLTLACNAGEAVNVEPGAMVSLSGPVVEVDSGCREEEDLVVFSKVWQSQHLEVSLSSSIHTLLDLKVDGLALLLEFQEIFNIQIFNFNIF